MSDRGDGHCILGEKGSYRRIVSVALGIGMAAFGVMAARLMFDRGHVIADLRGGLAVPTAICTMLMVLATGLAARSGFRGDRMGNARPDPSMAVFCTIALTGMAIAGFFIGRDYLRASQLMRNGIPVQAKLVRAFDRECGRAGCNIAVEYRFVPVDQSQPVEGVVRLPYGTRSRSNVEYHYVASTSTVPIMYDRTDPRRSIFFWGNQVVRRASLDNALELFAIVSGLILAGTVPLILAAWAVGRKRSAASA